MAGGDPPHPARRGLFAHGVGAKAARPNAPETTSCIESPKTVPSAGTARKGALKQEAQQKQRPAGGLHRANISTDETSWRDARVRTRSQERRRGCWSGAADMKPTTTWPQRPPAGTTTGATTSRVPARTVTPVKRPVASETSATDPSLPATVAAGAVYRHGGDGSTTVTALLHTRRVARHDERPPRHPGNRQRRGATDSRC